jgi:hypothetical protein
MIKMKIKTLLFLFLSISLFFSCSKEIEKFNKTITQGKWKITSYIENEQNYFDLYEDYEFTFSKNSELIVKKNNSIIKGNWVYADFFPVLIISNLTSPLSDFNAKFSVPNYNDEKIHLIKNEDNGTETSIILEKN